MRLDDEQRKRLAETGTLSVRDEDSGQCYVLLRDDVYENLLKQAASSEPPGDEDTSHLGWEAGSGIGWEDPEMAEYDDAMMDQIDECLKVALDLT